MRKLVEGIRGKLTFCNHVINFFVLINHQPSVTFLLFFFLLSVLELIQQVLRMSVCRVLWIAVPSVSDFSLTPVSITRQSRQVLLGSGQYS